MFPDIPGKRSNFTVIQNLYSKLFEQLRLRHSCLIFVQRRLLPRSKTFMQKWALAPDYSAGKEPGIRRSFRHSSGQVWVPLRPERKIDPEREPIVNQLVLK